MRKKTSENKTGGFTLVEIIVVLVVVAVLAAALIPTMSGVIYKARESLALTEARNCLTAVRVVAIERHGEGTSYDLESDRDLTLAMAEAPDKADLTLVTTAADTVTEMDYTASNGLFVKYKDNAFTVYRALASSFSQAQSLANAYTILTNAHIIPAPNGRYIYPGTEEGDKALALFAENGLDLDAMTGNWSIRYSRPGSWPKLYWTDEDLSSYGNNETVVKAFTLDTQRYTVWKVRLTTVNGKLCLGSEAGLVTTVTGAEQSYEQMLADYAAAIAG